MRIIRICNSLAFANDLQMQVWERNAPLYQIHLMKHCRNTCRLHVVTSKAGLKWTVIRHALLHLLHEHRTWTAVDLIKEIHLASPSTIYRNLEALVKHGIVAPIVVHNGETYYEQITDREHHDHLICKKCNAVECTPCPAPKLEEHRLELTSVCSSCV